MTTIAKTCVIHDGVTLGSGVVIKDFVVIYPNTVIHDNVEIMEGAVIGRMPKGARAVARPVSQQFGKTVIGEGSVISPHVVIYTDVSIGAGTLIGDGASVREGCVIGDECIISRSVTVNYNTVIGNRTKVMDNTHLTGNMQIGDDVFISVLVASTNDNNIGAKGYSESIQGPIIEDKVRIGAGANLLPGVRIGYGSIVGASALVTKDVPPMTLVKGVPAQVIRSLP